MSRQWPLWIAALALGGCTLLFDGSDLTGGLDGGVDGAVDGGQDGGLQSMPDAQPDAEPPSDGGPLCADVDCSHLDAPCVRGVCNGGTGACMAQARPTGAVCIDATACEPAATCDRAGACVPGVPNDGIAFTDVTTERGLPRASGGQGLLWLDIEPDGDLDLFVRGVGLFVSSGSGSFDEEAAARGITDVGEADGPVAIGDYDGDGRIDIFVGNDTRDGTSHNRMYQNLGDGRFQNVASAFGLELAENTPSAGVFVDHDGDNDLDFLYSNEFNPPRMYRNDRSLPFADDSARFSTHLQGDVAAWADYDEDGDQDLFIGVAGISGVNRLFQYDGTSWVDIAEGSGVGHDPESSSRWRAATWIDIDADGDLDLHLVTNGPGDIVYLNRGDGTFAETLATSLGLADGESAAWGDYDLDGDLDVFLGTVGLFRNDGGTFTDVTSALGITWVGMVGAWGDFDGDGRIDLLTTTPEGTRLWRNTYTAAACRPTMGAVHVRVTTDGDGDTSDAFTDDDRDAIGARVDVDLDGDGDFVGGGYEGPDRLVTYLVGSAQGDNRVQSQLRLPIGVGAASRVDIRVRFVDGSVVVRSGVASGARITIGDR